jgi:hypothetical protein
MENKELSKIIARIEKLEKAVFVGHVAKKEKNKHTIILPKDLNYSLNERAFVKRYTVNKSGPKKFTLLLSYLAKSKVGENISLSDIKKHWNKMKAKSLLGEFNMFYPNYAKTKGWVDVVGHGIYKLTKEWEQVL